MDSLVRTFANELIRHRRYNYSQEPLEQFLLVNPQVSCDQFKIANPRGNLIETVLLKKKSAKTCILYAHGLGSNKLEALSMAKYFLKQGYDVCSFDFSGSGRSEGQTTTYGLYQKEDLTTVLKHLQVSQRYSKIVLWGRSLGAVAVVLAHQDDNSKVQCLILDSPFSSFEKIAIEIASKKSFVPKFMLQMLIEPLKQYFQTNLDVNPFSVDLQKLVRKLNKKLLLIYSPNDSVVSCDHSKIIKDYCRFNPSQIIINEDHNMQRSKSTFHKAYEFIAQAGKEAQRRVLMSRSKNRGISVTSKDKKDRQSIRSMSKIKLLHPSSGKLSQRISTNKLSQKHIYTLNNTNPSMESLRRMETQISPTKKRSGRVYSIFSQKLPEQRMTNLSNKENHKPSLNMIRRNRFRK